MEERYRDFVEKNPTIESRIEAFTSGILSPDTKAITLWAMEPGRFYTRNELYTRVKEFSGGDFPVVIGSVWAYCNGFPPRWEGSLYNIGAVLKDEIEIMQTEGLLINVSYSKSDAGEDFGDCLAARALLLSQRLNSRYKSMLRIFGASNKSKTAKTRRGYSVYKIIKELATHPHKTYTEKDLEQKLIVNPQILSFALNALGQAGVIYYESPYRDIKGEKVRGWRLYWLDNNLLKKNLEEVFDEIKLNKNRFRIKGHHIKEILNYIRDNPNEKYECNTISQKLKIYPCNVSLILSYLNRLGYLKSEFKGKEKTKVKSNQNASLLWKILIEPIEAIAQRVDPDDYKGFYEPLGRYENEEIRKQDIQHHLFQIYENERTHRGFRGSEEIDSILLSLSNREMKLSEIKEIVEKRLRRRMSSEGIGYHLAKLITSGNFDKTRKGVYIRK